VSNDAATPALGFLAAVALAVIALLFIEMPGSPVMVTSTRTAAPAPPPNMTSQDVLAAQPKSAPDLRAEAPPKNRVRRHIGYEQIPLFDRFSIKGY
jgi:hypothetical protein